MLTPPVLPGHLPLPLGRRSHNKKRTASLNFRVPPDRRPSSTHAMMPLPNYPVITNQELPQLPPDGPYGRPLSLPGPIHGVHVPNTPPMNGTPQEASPYSAPPKYRSRMSFQRHGLSVISPGRPPPYDASHYQNSAFGALQRKAVREQQVYLMDINDSRLARVEFV